MTSKCTDQRLGEKLYAWELGMLDDEAHQELELHLMECNACFEKAQKLSAAADLLRSSERVRRAVENDTSAATSRVSRRWSNIVRVSLVAAAALVVLLLQPWQLEFRPTLEAVAAENRLAVIGFENLSDPGDSARWGDVVTELLITDLSESRYLQVISSKRVHDIARGLETEETVLARRETAATVAKEASARYYLTGAVIESGGQLTLTSHLIDLTSGVVLASQEVAALAEESVFDLVDRLSVEVRHDLYLPERAQEELDRPVAEVTTNSTEAYRYYLEGIEGLERMYQTEAKNAFERAVEADTTFAMAYYHLAHLGRTDLLEKAIEYSSQASRKEQHYIMAAKADLDHDWEEQAAQLRQLVANFPDEKEAWHRLGTYHNMFLRYDSAIVYFREAIRLDPFYRAAYNALTYAYSYSGDFARAIETIDRYIALAPDEANPWDSRGDLFAAHGYADRAAESFARALEIKPDFIPSTLKLARMRIFLRQYTAADSVLNELEGGETFETRLAARLYQVYIPLYQGRLAEALEAIDRAISQNRVDAKGANVNWERTVFHTLKAQIYAEQSEFGAALSQIDTCQDIFSRNYPKDSVRFVYRMAEYLAGQRRFEQAEEQQRRLASYTEATGRAPCYAFWSGGAIELARGNPSEATRYLEGAAEITTVSNEFYGHYLLARAYLDAGDLSQAVSLFEELLKIYSAGRLNETIAGVKTHYYLGLAYEKSQWPDKAAEQYETFLTIWQNADPGLEVVTDARERLSRLKTSS